MNNSINVHVYDNYDLYEQGLKRFEWATILIYDPNYTKYWQGMYDVVHAIDDDFKPFEWLGLRPGKNDGYFHRCTSLNKQEFISEFKKRYKFLQANYLFLLAPLIREEADTLYQNRKNDYERINAKFIPDKQIYIGIDKYLFALIENFMFFYKKGEENWVEKHPLYKNVMALKDDNNYLEDVKRGIAILEKEKEEKNLDKINLSLFDLFLMMRGFIQGEQNFTHWQKLAILDEYFRVSRHGNDDRCWESGFKLTDSDIKRNLEGDWHEVCGRNCHSVIYVNGPGCFNSPFIEGFSKMEEEFIEVPVMHNGRIVSRKTLPNYKRVDSKLNKQDCLELYLEGHDELAWYLHGKCESDDTFTSPKGTSPCLSNFKIIEENIFCLGDNFYQLCSNCGYIVNVTDKIDNPRIKKRIKERCLEDASASKKQLLLSELINLDGLEKAKELVKAKSRRG